MSVRNLGSLSWKTARSKKANQILGFDIWGNAEKIEGKMYSLFVVLTNNMPGYFKLSSIF